MHAFLPAQPRRQDREDSGPTVRSAYPTNPKYTYHSPRSAQSHGACAMTISDVNYAVRSGRCTWIQVYDTLINAGASHFARRQFIDGKLDIPVTAERMIARLILTGQVQLVAGPLA